MAAFAFSGPARAAAPTAGKEAALKKMTSQYPLAGA